VSILIIEDDERVASMLKRGLEAEGFGVRLSRDGVQGLAQAGADEHRLVILDLHLPKMHGLEVCRELRVRGIKTPVLMLTARDTLSDKVTGLNAGADDYMTKPFEFEELLARVNALVRRGDRYEARPARVTIDDFVFDRDSLRARRGDRTIELTSTEISILELLLEKPGAIYSREKILASIWGDAVDPDSNLVEVYIGKLRRKIDAEGERPLIETLRGRGYRLSSGEFDS
jgi:DNA-binding response OmpR family regulator